MKAMVFDGPGSVSLRDLPPEGPGPGEVLVRVAACGVCGTDLHIHHGEEGSAAVRPPVVLGHEFAGVVARLGEGVAGLREGDAVAIDPNRYCGECEFCRVGKKQLCERLTAVGVNRDGGFAETCRVPASLCHRIDPSVPLEVAALAEPLSCCLHGIDRAGIRPGDSVCVVGGGSIGLMMVQLARLAGASAVVLSEPRARQRAVGLSLGATAAADPLREDLAAVVREAAGTDGVDIVLECAGRPEATAQAFSVAKRGASLLLFSVPKPGATHPLDLMDVFRKELRIAGSFINPDTFSRAVRLIESGAVRLAPLVTHRFPLDRLEEAFRMQAAPESIKVVVVP